MPDPLAHVYDLALRALAEQERQVTALHGRLAPVLAAGGLGATLLAPAAFRGHPAGPLRVVSIGVGLVGIVIAVISATYVLLPRRLAFGLDASIALALVRRGEAADASGFFESMTIGLDDCRLANAPLIDRLHVAFTLVLGGMLVGVCGLAVAAAIA